MKKLMLIATLVTILLLQTTVFAQDDIIGGFSEEQIVTELPLDERQKIQLKYEKLYLDSIFTTAEKYFGDTEGFNKYGEIYIDNDNDFKFVVAISEPNDKVTSFIGELQEIIPQELLIIEKVNYSKDDLIAVQNEIIHTLQTTHPHFSSLNAVVSSSVKDQAVTLTITQPVLLQQEEESSIISELLFKYKELLKIENGSKNEPAKLRTDEFNVLGGGIYVSTILCSTTGIATKDTREFLITAGHCINNKGGSVSQGGTTIGTEHYSAYTNGGTDVGLILLTNKKKKFSNEFYYSNVANAEYDKKYTTTTSVLTNQLLCKSGNTTGVTCGNVSSTSTSVTYGSIVLSNLIAIYKAAGGVVDGGDSGGIVFDAYSTTRLVGIVSGKSLADDTYPDGAWGYITKIAPALTAAGNVTLYTSDTVKAVDPEN